MPLLAHFQSVIYRLPCIGLDNQDTKMVEQWFGPGAQGGNMEYPIAIKGPHNSPRIATQKGVFTLFPPKSAKPLDTLALDTGTLVKLRIEDEDVEKIAEELTMMGMTRANLFPELASVAEDIKREVRRRNSNV